MVWIANQQTLLVVYLYLMLRIVASYNRIVEAIHSSMEALLHLAFSITTHLAQATHDERDVEAADDALIALGILEDEPILQGIVISENRQTRTAAHFEAKTRPGARVGATLGLLGAANCSRTTHVPVNVVVSSLHVTVCQYVKAMLTRVIAGETAEKSTTTWQWIYKARLMHFCLPFISHARLHRLRLHGVCVQ